MKIPKTRAGKAALATLDFVAQSREAAVCQYAVVAMDLRSGCTGKIGRTVARRAMKKANRIKRAVDWRSVYLALE